MPSLHAQAPAEEKPGFGTLFLDTALDVGGLLLKAVQERGNSRKPKGSGPERKPPRLKGTKDVRVLRRVTPEVCNGSLGGFLAMFPNSILGGSFPHGGLASLPLAVAPQVQLVGNPITFFFCGVAVSLPPLLYPRREQDLPNP